MNRQVIGLDFHARILEGGEVEAARQFRAQAIPAEWERMVVFSAAVLAIAEGESSDGELLVVVEAPAGMGS